ncbi:hypothetical protein SAMN04487898_115129 [Pedobacter sp. ok626]|uniref:hypothetical protein n=1 Tax=Pedobacter sp. ok626 TaxID=1761882 RepID=UPI000890DA23|nr:hypothetical protein [Pedobacter sp. ok626]SDL15154.1 hypothetical protein SAMN04487898_115129 [Pedobacter sp. ok626]
MNFKNITYAALAFLIVVAACKKNKNAPDESKNGSSGPLINESTGWKKVGTIPFIHAVSAFAGSYAMTPYDLAVLDNQLALLYSEDYKMTGVQGNLTYKVKFTPGSPIPASIPLQRGGWAFCYSSRFIPGTFTPVYMKMEGSSYSVSIYRDEEGPIAGNNTDYVTPAIRPINWYTDGGLSMTTPGGNKQAYVLSYTFPNTGNFTVAENVWRLDPTTWRAFDAMRLSDGKVNQFLVSTEGSKVYFSMLKNNPDFVSRTGMEPSFFTLARQEMPGLDAANLTSANMIIASNVVNDKYTVLIGETASAGSLGFNKVHCYQWQAGSTQFTKLYGDVAVPEDIGRNFMSRATTGTRPVEGSGASVKFTPENTAYMLYSYSPSNYVQRDKYTALAVVSATGAKTVGKYATADYPNGQYEQVDLGVCQYYNGAYYAVVYQKREDLFSISDSRFRMEIVKLNP